MEDPRPPELARWLAAQRELSLLWAHDLRNPIAALLANVGFLELSIRPEDRELLEAVSDMRVSAEMLLRLIDNFVAVSRLESEPVLPPDVAREFYPGAAARAAFERMQPMFARAPNVRVSLEVRDEDARVRGDGALFELMVENLFANVLQHVRRGGRGTLVVERAGANGEEVALELSDDGPPFGPAERDFSREGQMDLKKRSDARYSRGLALYVVGSVARAMGGRVEVAEGAARGGVRLTFPRVV